MINKQRIAITGANGYVGKELLKELDNLNYSVSLLYRTRNKSSIENEKKHSVIYGDLSSKKSLSKLLKNRTVLINLAGEYLVENLMMDTNYEGVKNLFEVAENSTITTFIHLSSVGVYGRPKKGIVSEESKIIGINHYEESKIYSEKALFDKANKNIKTIILRPSNIFGPHMKNQSLKDMCHSIHKGRFIFIGKKGASANYLYIDNLLKSIIKVIEKPNKNSENIETFNLNQNITMEKLVSAILQNNQNNKSFFRLPYLFVYFLAYIADVFSNISKIELPLTRSRVDALSSHANFIQGKFDHYYGYSHESSMEEGIKECLDLWQIAIEENPK